MGRPPSLRFIRSAIRASLILLCIFAVPELARSEGDALTDQDIISSQRPKVIHRDVRNLGNTSLRLFAENKDCATVKLDIWLQRGTVTHSASLSDGGVSFRTAGGEKGRTIIIGGAECRIRIRIEAVPADTSIFD